MVPVRTPTLPPATHTNTWILGEQRVTVVDPASPYPEEQQRLWEALSSVQVDRILLTHHHWDHVGGVEDLRQRTGAPVLAHPLTRDRVPFEVDQLIDEGDSLRTDRGTWNILHTPGHATGHVCLQNQETGIVVAGDMVAGLGTIVLEPPEGVLSDYIESLSRLRSREPTALLPAHGPRIDDARAKLTEYIEHRHMRTAQVMDALSTKGPAQPIDLVPEIYAGLIPTAAYPLAACQVLCHLLWLENNGRVQRIGDSFEVDDSHR